MKDMKELENKILASGEISKDNLDLIKNEINAAVIRNPRITHENKAKQKLFVANIIKNLEIK